MLPNISATMLFRSYFKTYTPLAKVLGPCLVFGSLNINLEKDYQHHSAPIQSLLAVIRASQILAKD